MAECTRNSSLTESQKDLSKWQRKKHQRRKEKDVATLEKLRKYAEEQQKSKIPENWAEVMKLTNVRLNDEINPQHTFSLLRQSIREANKIMEHAREESKEQKMTRPPSLATPGVDKMFERKRRPPLKNMWVPGKVSVTREEKKLVEYKKKGEVVKGKGEVDDKGKEEIDDHKKEISQDLKHENGKKGNNKVKKAPTFVIVPKTGKEEEMEEETLQLSEEITSNKWNLRNKSKEIINGTIAEYNGLQGQMMETIPAMNDIIENVKDGLDSPSHQLGRADSEDFSFMELGNVIDIDSLENVSENQEGPNYTPRKKNPFKGNLEIFKGLKENNFEQVHSSEFDNLVAALLRDKLSKLQVVSALGSDTILKLQNDEDDD